MNERMEGWMDGWMNGGGREGGRKEGWICCDIKSEVCSRLIINP